MTDVNDMDRLRHPDRDTWVPRKMARDLGLLGRAEDATARFLERDDGDGGEPAQSQEPIGVEIEEFLGDAETWSSGDAQQGQEQEQEPRRPPQEEDVVDGDSWLGDGAGRRSVGRNVTPFYTSTSRARVTANDDEEEPPDIDKRARDWTDDGRTRYARTDDGGMRVRRGQ